jgi:hypothetical protein
MKLNTNQNFWVLTPYSFLGVSEERILPSSEMKLVYSGMGVVT